MTRILRSVDKGMFVIELLPVQWVGQFLYRTCGTTRSSYSWDEKQNIFLFAAPLCHPFSPKKSRCTCNSPMEMKKRNDFFCTKRCILIKYSYLVGSKSMVCAWSCSNARCGTLLSPPVKVVGSISISPTLPTPIVFKSASRTTRYLQHNYRFNRVQHVHAVTV